MKFKENTKNNNIQICVEDKPEILGIIKKQPSQKRYKNVYIIKFYWNDKFQGTKYADDIEQAKIVCKNNLKNMLEQAVHVQTFENFRKIYEFNKKDINQIKSSGIAEHFTMSFEFEMESLDPALALPEKTKRLFSTSKSKTIKQLNEEGIEYDESFINNVLSTFDIEEEDDIFDDALNTDNYEGDKQYIVLVLGEIFEEELNKWNTKNDNQVIPDIIYAEEMVEKNFPNFYKKYHKDLKFEFDMALVGGVEFSPKTYVVSLDEGMKMIEDFFKDFEKQKYFNINNIDVNIGLTDKDVEWNIPKGMVMLKDVNKDDVPYVYKGIEQREDNGYTGSLYKFLKKHFKDDKPENFNVTEIEKTINDVIDEEIQELGYKSYAFNVIHLKDEGYVEFRYIGGNISKELMIDKIMYFCYIIYLMTSTYKDKEYKKKLYKLVYN